MTLLQIQYFIEVQKWRSFSVAAEKNFVSQSTISTAITQLETELGQQLFSRGRPLKLTQAGQDFLYYGREFLEHYDFMCSFMKKDEHIIRVGISPMISAIILPSILQKAKGMTVTLTERYREELLRNLETGVVDILFIYDAWAEKSDFNVKIIQSAKRMLCAHRRFALPLNRPLQIADLKGIPLALRSRDSFLNKLVRDDFEASGIQPTIICETDQIKTLELIISTGSGVAFLDEALFVDQPDVLAYPYTKGMKEDTINISLVYKRGQRFPKHIQDFIDSF